MSDTPSTAAPGAAAPAPAPPPAPPAGPERRAYFLDFIKKARGDVVATVLETGSDQDLEIYVESLKKSSALTGERLPGMPAPPKGDDKKADDGAAPSAKVEKGPGVEGTKGVAKAEIKRTPEDIRKEALDSVNALLSELQTAVRTATTQELEGVQLSLKSGLAKVAKKAAAAPAERLATPGLSRKT